LKLDRSVKEILLDCCSINLKLGDLQKAQRYESQAISERPGDIETQIAHIQILERQGNKALATTAFKQYRQRILTTMAWVFLR
jgi:hypothetical protein